MHALYSLLLTIAFIVMLPLFVLRREKYASGFKQRLGNYPDFEHAGRQVIWLHCVSVGETNAARPLVDQLLETFRNHRLVISTTTKTGQELAQKIFADKAHAVVYFPFDWKFSVRRALRHFKPSVVLLMETEIWPRFIREAKLSGAKIAIVNGRLSEKSFRRYSMVRPFIRRVLRDIDLALMQGEKDADRITTLGIQFDRAKVTGNLKFEQSNELQEIETTEYLSKRFSINGDRPLIVAASTHEPEERWIIEAYCSAAIGSGKKPRLLIAPRHPERFDGVAKTIRDFKSALECEWNSYAFVRRSAEESGEDKDADVLLLDSIGELRAIYPLADIVFVGGSLIPHGGQSVLEPAAVGKAIITGPHTQNFDEVVTTFRANKALVQLPEARAEVVVDGIFMAMSDLLENETARDELGRNAAAVMKANRGATNNTAKGLRELLNATSGTQNGRIG